MIILILRICWIYNKYFRSYYCIIVYFFIIKNIFHYKYIYIFAVQNVNVGLFSERFIMLEGKTRCMNRYCHRNFEDVNYVKKYH